jgi:SAM-dependent methyltransferase
MGEIIKWPKPSTPLRFTGERLTTAYGGQTEIEHLHRYLVAREWCRDKDVLDVASGEGYGTALLAQVARRAVGVEIASEAVDHASEAYRTNNLSFVVGDARSLPCPDAAFDVVTSFETIEHFSEQQRFLSEIRRVLRPGGLLIISTPDRDNYSPSESAANPYHVQELSREEFDALLRSYFAEVSVLLQRPIFGSILFPNGGNKTAPLCFERRGDGHFEGSLNLPRPQYIVAFASDDPVPPPPPSVYIDTGRLGMLRPSEADAQLRLLQGRINNELEPLRAELSASREEVRNLLATRHELAAARDEVKGLLAANEMAERACALVRHELAGAREEARGVRAAKETAERANESLRGELAQCQENLVRVRAAKRRIWPVRAFREVRRFGRRLGKGS